jgi:hypothetical protein
LDLGQVIKPGNPDFLIEHNVPNDFLSLTIDNSDVLLHDSVIKLENQTLDSVPWSKLVTEDPTQHLVSYLSFQRKQLVIKKKQIVLTEEEKIIRRIIGLMEKSKFKSKNILDLKRQLKQQAKTACPDYKNDELEKITDLVIIAMD